MQEPMENFQPKPDQAINIKSQAAQLKDKIQSKEKEIGNRISYSIGNGDREVIILAQPIKQQTEVDWGDKMRLVDRNRYIVVGSFGIGAIDFIKQAKFDASDNLPETDDKLSLTPKVESTKYPPEGVWRAMDVNGDDGRSEASLLRSLETLDGIDKTSYDVTQNISSIMHERDGFGLLPDGSAKLSIGVDFATIITLNDVTVEDFSSAIQKSIENAKPIELKTDVTKQASLLTAAMDSF